MSSIFHPQEISTADFFSAIFPPGTPGSVAIVTEKENEECNHPSFVQPSDIGWMQYVAQWKSINHDTYFAINTVNKAAAQARSDYARGTEAEIVAVTMLAADIDATKPGNKHHYPPQSKILEAIASMPLAPSFINLSGREDGGFHVGWLFTVPVEIHDEAQRAYIKSLSVRWQALLKSKLRPFDMDGTADLTRVLRPVGTANHKYGSTVASLVFEPSRRYTPEEFEAALPPEKPKAIPARRPAPVAAGSANRSADISAIEQARAYVAANPHGSMAGTSKTWKMALALVRGFDLPISEALPLFQQWNKTRPTPRTDLELWHKLQDAADKSSVPVGYKLQQPATANAENTDTSGTGAISPVPASDLSNCSYEGKEALMSNWDNDTKFCPNSITMLGVKAGGIGRGIFPCGKRHDCEFCANLWRKKNFQRFTTHFEAVDEAGGKIYYAMVDDADYSAAKKAMQRTAKASGVTLGYVAIRMADSPDYYGYRFAVFANVPISENSETITLPQAYEELADAINMAHKGHLRPISASRTWGRIDAPKGEFTPIKGTVPSDEALDVTAARWGQKNAIETTYLGVGVAFRYHAETLCPAEEFPDLVLVDDYCTEARLYDRCGAAAALEFHEEAKRRRTPPPPDQPDQDQAPHVHTWHESHACDGSIFLSCSCGAVERPEVVEI
jgi:hypothetical protein